MDRRNVTTDKITFHKTLKVNLPQQVTTDNQIHFTEDGEIYINKNDGTFIRVGASSDGDVGSPDDYLSKAEYKGSQDGIVKKSDTAIEIEGIVNAQPLMYYGTDEQGNVGVHKIPDNNNTVINGIEQVVALSVANGDVRILNTNSLSSDTKCLIQTYKFQKGEQNIIKTIKEFNNANKESFRYNKDNVIFEDVSKMNDMYLYAMSQHNTTRFFETETMNKADFLEIKGILIS